MLDKIERYVKRNVQLEKIADKLAIDVPTLIGEIASSEISLKSFTSGVEDEDVIASAREAYLYALLS